MDRPIARCPCASSRQSGAVSIGSAGLFILFLLLFLVLLVSPLVRRARPGPAAVPRSSSRRRARSSISSPATRSIARSRERTVRRSTRRSLRDVVDALRAARDDRRIKAVVLDLDELAGGGLSKLQDVADEIPRLQAEREARHRDRRQLHARSVLPRGAGRRGLHESDGPSAVDGYARFLPYYKSLLEKFYVDYNVWTVGEYKSFVEPITRDDMSPQDEETSRAFLNRFGAHTKPTSRRRGSARRPCSSTPTTS